MNKLSVFALAASATFGISAHAASVIDNFDVPQTFLDDKIIDSAGVASQVSGSTSNIIGGFRDLYISKEDGDEDGNLGGNVFVSGSNLRMSSDEGQAMVAIVRWDGNAIANSMNGLDVDAAIGSIDADGLGGENLAIEGIAFQVTAASDVSFSIEFQVYSGDGFWSTLTKSNLNAVDTFAFADFQQGLGASGAADFANVGAIQMIINYTSMASNADLRVDIIQAVPEPGSLALAGLALAGLGMARRRKVAAK